MERSAKDDQKAWWGRAVGPNFPPSSAVRGYSPVFMHIKRRRTPVVEAKLLPYEKLSQNIR